ncbi:hypothetical protein Y032_0046g1319 [Ancylostoma ceylanicum]|nr:hypothetical protein Y032_0046g1319 [Ancylostoma ceylanicum]
MSRNQWQPRPQPLTSARRGFNPPFPQRRLPNGAVANALPTVRWNGPVQEIHPELIDAKASESAGFKNGASIFAGNMSREFLKEMSDYIYGLITGKLSTRPHRTRSRALRRGGHSTEVLDYEDDVRARDAEERRLAQHRSLAVVQAPTRTAIPLRTRSRPWVGVSRRKPTSTRMSSGVSSGFGVSRTRFRSGIVA